MASHTTRSRLAIIAALMLAAFMTQLPAFAEDASAPAPAAPDMGTSAAPFDPYVGESSDGVLYGPQARATGWTCFGRRATIVGTSNNDRIYGTKNQDVIVGLGGDDLISSGEKNDFACGGDGDDQLHGLQDFDRLDGGGGADGLWGGDGNDFVYGRGGNDRANGEGGTDYIYGGDGRDTLTGGGSGGDTGGDGGGDEVAPITRVLNADSFDYVYGGPDNDTISGGDQGDNLYGQGGTDTLNGDDGADRMVGGPASDTFLGGPDDDVMNGAGGNDSFDGEDGNDSAWGDGGKDYVAAGPGADTSYGGADQDLLNGGEDGDAIFGDGDIDILCGGGGIDTISGGDGDDLISGEGECGWDSESLGEVFSSDSGAVPNILNGNGGDNACVSPSKKLSPQTRNCANSGSALQELEISVNGAGGYVETSGPPTEDFFAEPIYCDSTDSPCYFYFLPGETVDLTAVETSGLFTTWSGAAGCGTGLDCSVTMNSNRSVTATFATQVTLNVVNNHPAGTITGTGGINCGPGSVGTCSAVYAQGAAVSLVAGAGATWAWAPTGVTVTSCSTTATCSLTMTANGSVTLTGT